MKDKTILCTGCFDILTRNHVELLDAASELGRVVVGINDDASVRKLKGPTRPVNCLRDRLFVIEALGSVTYAFAIHSTKVTNAILQLRPDVWCKGGDYSMDTLDKEEVEAARNVGAEIVIFPKRPGCSTTETLRRLEAK